MQILSKQQSSPAPSSIGSLAMLPVFFNLRGKCALVAGGSAAAAWKAELLAAAGAEVHVYAEVLSEEMSALTGGSLLVHHPCDWSKASFQDAAIAVADMPTDEQACDFLHAAIEAGVPCNVIDRPAFCQFQFGSIVNRSPVVIGISTDGAAPILGQAIRRRVEALLPASLPSWAHLAKAVRSQIGDLLKPGPQRRRFWEEFVDRAFSSDHAPDEVSLLNSVGEIAAANRANGSVTEIAIGSDDPELLALRSVRAMQMADVILFNKSVAPAILHLGRREAAKICLASDGQDHESVTEKLRAEGKSIVVLKSGDPDWIRTSGLQIRNLSLYPTELRDRTS
jgi:uroporphyrin-III C-methyltransferase / precorrin-2 dehydrogenase / sirohydrochlorin ferrochelatase